MYAQHLSSIIYSIEMTVLVLSFIFASLFDSFMHNYYSHCNQGLEEDKLGRMMNLCYSYLYRCCLSYFHNLIKFFL